MLIGEGIPAPVLHLVERERLAFELLQPAWRRRPGCRERVWCGRWRRARPSCLSRSARAWHDQSRSHHPARRRIDDRRALSRRTVRPWQLHPSTSARSWRSRHRLCWQLRARAAVRGFTADQRRKCGGRCQEHCAAAGKNRHGWAPMLPGASLERRVLRVKPACIAVSRGSRTVVHRTQTLDSCLRALPTSASLGVHGKS